MGHWAELRREHFVRGMSIKELSRRTGLSPNTVPVGLRSSTPPRSQRVSRAPSLDPFKDEIHRLLKNAPALLGQRLRGADLAVGVGGRQAIVDD